MIQRNHVRQHIMKIKTCLKTALGMETECAEKEGNRIAGIIVSAVDFVLSKIKGTVVSFSSETSFPLDAKGGRPLAVQTAGIGGNSALTLLVIGMAAIVFGQQTTIAQSYYDNPDINSPGSVLHGRTKEVAYEIIRQLGNSRHHSTMASLHRFYRSITSAQLSSITSLDLSGKRIFFLRRGDFEGLDNLQTLDLSVQYPSDLRLLGLGSDYEALPSGIFDNLVNLRSLNLGANRLTTLPSGIFDELANLQTLKIGWNSLSSLPVGIFDNLVNLKTLDFRMNHNLQVSTDLLRGLTNLETYNGGDLPWVNSPGSVLHGRTTQVANAILYNLPGITRYNQVTNLAQLSGITSIDLFQRELYFLQAGDFEGLSNLQALNLARNPLTTLPAGIFDNLVNLETLHLLGDPRFGRHPTTDTPTSFVSLPAGLFDNLDNLRIHPETYAIYAQLMYSFHWYPSNYGAWVREESDAYAEYTLHLRLRYPPSRDIVFDYTTRDLNIELNIGDHLRSGTNFFVDGLFGLEQVYRRRLTYPASAGQDYIATSGTITFSADVSSIGVYSRRYQHISVPIIDDNLDDPDRETFLLYLTDRSNGRSLVLPPITIIEEGLEDPPTPILNFAHSAFLSILEGDEGTTTAALNV